MLTVAASARLIPKALNLRITPSFPKRFAVKRLFNLRAPEIKRGQPSIQKGPEPMERGQDPLMMFQRLAIANGYGWQQFPHMVDQVLPRRGDTSELPLEFAGKDEAAS